MLRRWMLRFGFFAGIVARRGLGDRGQRRRLGHVEVADRLAEVALGGGLDAVGAVAEVDLVEVELEDLVLGVLLLDLAGDLGLAELPAERLVAPADVLGPDVPRQLHRDGREPLGHPHLEQVALDRAEHPEPVDPVVLVEALVLGGDERRLDVPGDISPSGTTVRRSRPESVMSRPSAAYTLEAWFGS